MRHFPRLSTTILLATSVLLGGCAGLLDPYERAGTWKMTGINQDNLRAMVQNPADLERGTGASGSNGQEATNAVGRLLADKVRPLPQSTLSSVGGTSGSGGSGSASGGGQ